MITLTVIVLTDLHGGAGQRVDCVSLLFLLACDVRWLNSVNSLGEIQGGERLCF